MTMYAVKFQNGRTALLGTLPKDAVDSFEFDMSELPKSPDEERSYTLDIDFENKSFTLVPKDAPEVEPEPTEEDDTAAMLVDHEYRLTLLELGLTE